MMLEACALHLHLLAYHAEPEFETAVPGIGALCETSVPDLRLIAGGFRNSIGRGSLYAGASWQPLHMGPVRVGMAAGLITGYYKDLQPLAAGVVSFPLAERLEGHLTLIPKIQGKTPATVQFSISVGF